MGINQAQGFLGIYGGTLDAVEEEFAAGVMGATEGGQDTVVVQQAESTEVDFLVSPHGVFDCFLVPSEGRRVEDNEVVSFFVLPKKVEGIGSDGGDFHPAQFCVSSGCGGGFLRDVDGGYRLSTSQFAGQAESSLVAEYVQHLAFRGMCGDAGVGGHNIKVESGFLPVGGVDLKNRALMSDGKGSRTVSVHHPDFLFESLRSTHRRVVSQSNGFGP